MDANLLKLLQGDETYKQFLQESFDDKSYANAIIQGRVISKSLSKLADGISLLNEELHSQVVSHHEDLLQQATGIETLEGVLQMMQTQIQSLMSSIERIQHLVTEPYNKIASRTAQLRRLQGACDILRRVIRILALSKRMQAQLQGGSREITKAAQSLCELDYLMQGADLSGIHIVEKDLLMIENARAEVESQARKMLNQGIESQSQTQVATALQVFYNLGSLQTTVNDAVDKLREELKTAVKSCLDSATLLESQTSNSGSSGHAAIATPGNTAAWRAALWTRMEKLMDNIYSICGQVHHLQKVLAKKRDPVTHVCFMEELTKDGNTSVNMFWKAVTHILAHEFAETAQASTFLKQAFEGEYPKLLRLYNDLWIRLQQYCGMNIAGGPLVVQSLEPAFGLFMGYEEFDVSPQQALKDSLAPFEAAYLSRSLSRLLDPINLVLPVGVQNPPSKEELAGIAKTIGSELSVASVDEGLTVTVAKNVAKTIHLLTTKCEQLLSTSTVEEVQGTPTVAMQRNASLVNSLYHLHEAVAKIICGLKSPPRVAVDVIQTSLEGVSALINQAIDPVLDDMQHTIESMLLRMHSEDFARTSLPNDVTDVPGTPCSLYIREIQDFIHHFKTNHLSLYECQELMQERLLSVAGRILTLFVRHVSLLRVIGEGGKLKLAADMAQIEFAVGPLCNKVSDLGKPYKLLRSFRPLLFQTSEHILTNPAVGESLPPSIVLHYLFSRAPSELKYPHEVAGWSLLEYSHWLDQHISEDERLALIKGTLEAYVQSVRSRGDEEYASIYPIMTQVLQTASSQF